MSVTSFYYGGLERPDPVFLTTTSITDIVTGVDNTLVVASVSLADNTNQPVDVVLYYYDGTTDHVYYACQVPAGETVIVKDIPLRLYDGDKLKAEASLANDITVTAIVVPLNPNAPVRD